MPDLTKYVEASIIFAKLESPHIRFARYMFDLQRGLNMLRPIFRYLIPILAVTPAHAAYMTAQYSGQIVSVSQGSAFSVGDPITDRVTFDPAKLIDVTTAVNSVLVSQFGGTPLASVKVVSLADDPNASLSIGIDGISFSKYDQVDYGTPFDGEGIDLGAGDFPDVIYVNGKFAGIASMFAKGDVSLNTDPVAAAEGFLSGADFAIGDSDNLAFGQYDLSGVIFTPAAVPEPGAWAMMIAGLAAMGAAMRRKTAFAILARR